MKTHQAVCSLSNDTAIQTRACRFIRVLLLTCAQPKMVKKNSRQKVLKRSINKRRSLLKISNLVYYIYFRKERTKNRKDLKFEFKNEAVAKNWDSRKTLRQYAWSRGEENFQLSINQELCCSRPLHQLRHNQPQVYCPCWNLWRCSCCAFWAACKRYFIFLLMYFLMFPCVFERYHFDWKRPNTSTSANSINASQRTASVDEADWEIRRWLETDGAGY